MVAFVDKMFMQQQLTFILIQPLSAGVGGGLTNGRGEGARENQSRTSTTTDSLQETIGDEAVCQRLQTIWKLHIPTH